MAQTTYSTISVNYNEYEEEPNRSNLRKVTAVAAVLCAGVVMFFAGRVYEGQATPFTHTEVLDISAKCGTGQYIGGCVECKTCAAYEFVNGGCSFFKDAFCSYCEPIKNCDRENILCKTREDQICTHCNCHDPIVNWTDVELGRYLDYEMFDREEFAGMSQEAATYSCYYDDQCVPCTVCPIGFYQTRACVHGPGGMDGFGDTECTQCADCKQDQWVSQKCEYMTDTVCSDCTHYVGADMDQWTSSKCVRFAATGPLFNGQDAMATKCTKTDEHQWYSEPCTEFADSKSSDCYMCDSTRDCASTGGEYISKDCVEGTPGQVGVTTICNACTNQDEMPGFYENEVCDPLGHADAEWLPCTACMMGEYEHTKCRLSTDTICPPCYPINHCASEDTICSKGRVEEDQNSECIGGDTRSAEAPRFSCEKDFYGAQCHYWRTYADCGVGPGYRERTVKTGKFRGETGEEFIAWCMMLCDEFPDCVGFEIGDEGQEGQWNETGEGKLTKPNSLCSMKNKASGSVSVPANTGLDCFTNLRRQEENSFRDIMATTPAELPKVTLYPGVGCVGGSCAGGGVGGDDWLNVPAVASMETVQRMLVREQKLEDGTAELECT